MLLLLPVCEFNKLIYYAELFQIWWYSCEANNQTHGVIYILFTVLNYFINEL